MQVDAHKPSISGTCKGTFTPTHTLPLLFDRPGTVLPSTRHLLRAFASVTMRHSSVALPLVRSGEDGAIGVMGVIGLLALRSSRVAAERGSFVPKAPMVKSLLDQTQRAESL